ETISDPAVPFQNLGDCRTAGKSSLPPPEGNLDRDPCQPSRGVRDLPGVVSCGPFPGPLMMCVRPRQDLWDGEVRKEVWVPDAPAPHQQFGKLVTTRQSTTSNV